MFFLESLRACVRSIFDHAFRSVLTVTGIVVGVLAVVAVVAMMEGFRVSLETQFRGMGSDTLSIRSRNAAGIQVRRAPITTEDYRQVERIDGIHAMTPILYVRSDAANTVSYGGRSFPSGPIGVSASYQEVTGTHISLGRFIAPSDDRKRRRVAVIGEGVRAALQLPMDPVGEYIRAGNEWLKVIGVMGNQGSYSPFGNNTLVPFGTMQSINGAQNEPNIFIRLKVRDPEAVEAIAAQIRRVLRASHGLTGMQADDFSIESNDQVLQAMRQTLNTNALVLSALVSVSLLVGGIGIMNVMLVSVTERTREIGICKALGAKRWHILAQFLMESVVLSLLGGAIGLLLGYSLVWLATTAPIANFPSLIAPAWAIWLAMGFSSAVGLVFGIVPAARAANLDPIEALRHA